MGDWAQRVPDKRRPIRIKHSYQGMGRLIRKTKGRSLDFFLIGVQLLYNVVLVSAVQHSESAICTHISSLFWISIPFRSPQSTEQSSLCYTAGSHQLSILYIVVIYVNPNLPIHPMRPFPPWCPLVCSLRLCLYFCFANRFICTIQKALKTQT